MIWYVLLLSDWLVWIQNPVNLEEQVQEIHKQSYENDLLKFIVVGFTTSDHVKYDPENNVAG